VQNFNQIGAELIFVPIAPHKPQGTLLTSSWQPRLASRRVPRLTFSHLVLNIIAKQQHPQIQMKMQEVEPPLRAPLNFEGVAQWLPELVLQPLPLSFLQLHTQGDREHKHQNSQDLSQ